MGKKKRRLSGVGIFFVILLISFVIFSVLSVTVLFPIKNITVEGDSKYSQEQIINASSISVGNNILLVSEKGVSRKVSKQLPYINSVKLKRDLKGNVKLTVVPEEKKYLCEFDKEYILISSQLKVLEKKSKADKKVAKILGIESCTAIEGERFKIDDATKNELFNTIHNRGKEYGINYAVIDLRNISDLTVQIEDRLVVKLGTSNDLDNKFAVLSEIVNSISENKKGVIDLKTLTSEKPEGYFRKQDIKKYFK